MSHRNYNMKSLISALVLVAYFPVVSMGDTGSPELARQAAFEEKRQIYAAITGREATPTNLESSLAAGSATGTSMAEVVAALDVMALSNRDPDILARQVLACYERNPRDLEIKLACARTLLGIDKAKGVPIAREILANSNSTLRDRLLAATYLTDVRELDGYSLLPEGLLSSNPIERRVAISLLQRFAKFDSMQVPASTEKIDVRRLVQKLKSQTTDPKILADLAGVRF
ncbi:MAG TPA: hypothetical protein VGO11_26255 [Chthoniobacteraceae bacterium]|jgi:hypothetical protein|nr:hypothetical protein [Chthoniobacteraceae bacterium]